MQVVITGAANGIGRALVQTYLREGARVLGIDVDGPALTNLHAEIAGSSAAGRFSHHLADLGDLAECQRLVAELPIVDCVIHSAGISQVAPFFASDVSLQKRVLDVNFGAPLFLTQLLLSADKLAPGGSIVFLASLACQVSYPGATVYAASKSALASLGRSLAVALAPKNINVLVVFPGPVRTEHARRYSPDNRHESRRMAPEVVAQRIADAVRRRQTRLFPGWQIRWAALLGVWAPRWAEFLMKRAIFNKLGANLRHDP